VLHRYTGTGKATGKKLNLLAAGVWDLHAAKSSATDSSQTPPRSSRSPEPRAPAAGQTPPGPNPTSR
jgi:hypothetical protein